MMLVRVMIEGKARSISPAAITSVRPNPHRNRYWLLVRMAI
jgi:hypothetical protein